MLFLLGHFEEVTDQVRFGLGSGGNKMDDIEDLGVDAPAHSPSRTNTRGGSVLPKALRTHHCPDRVAGTNIPGVGSVYVKTWGCAHNTSDGEYMAGLLAEYGYNITPGGRGRGACVAVQVTHTHTHTQVRATGPCHMVAERGPWQ